MQICTEADMSKAVKDRFKNSTREVHVGSCILDVVAYDKEDRLFNVVECKLGSDITRISQTFGQIAGYEAQISTHPHEFLDAYTRKKEDIHLRWLRLMEATDWNRRLRIAFSVALTDEACTHIDLIQSLKKQMPHVGIIRVKADGRCRDHLHVEGRENLELARAIPKPIGLTRE